MRPPQRPGRASLRWALPAAALLLVAGALPAAAQSPDPTAAPPAVTGNACPMVFDASSADFYPIQPSFSAGYTAAAQKLSSDTADWAYVVEGDFPYVYWNAWYLYDIKGVPLLKIAGADLLPEARLHQPVRGGQPDPRPGALVQDHVHARGHAGGRHQQHAGGGPERGRAARGRVDRGRDPRLAGLLVAVQRRPRELGSLRLRRPHRHARAHHHRIPDGRDDR